MVLDELSHDVSFLFPALFLPSTVQIPMEARVKE
jgi:hypothetical protein